METKYQSLLLEVEKETRRIGNPEVEPEHILLVDLHHRDGVINNLAVDGSLDGTAVNIVRSIVDRLINVFPINRSKKEIRNASKRLQSCFNSIKNSNENVSWEQLIISIFKLKETISDDPLGIALFNTGISFPSNERLKEKKKTQFFEQHHVDIEETVLPECCVDLVKLAEEGKLNDAIGRSWEIENIILTLRMKANNNPLLIGDPGVGKTQIVEALAKKIHEGTAGLKLNGSRIYRLDIGSLMSGTEYRGMFEKRLKAIVNFIKEQKGKAILFVDEIHLLLGAGKTEGSMDAANLIKPELARGELPLIGATTYSEFRKYFEKDEAFKSRFNEIYVEEPSEIQMFDILRGSAQSIASYHDVSVSEEVLKTIVSLSKRYLSEECFPRKAFKVLGKVCAVAERSKEKGERDIAEVTVNDVVVEISGKTGIPVDIIQNSASDKLLNIEDILKRKIVGQENVIDKIVSKLKLLTLPRDISGEPRGVFLFAGPSGVGKTEIARIIAQELYGTDKHFLKLNMAEYTESHSASRLLGADPGTIGYEDGGALTEPIRRRPYSLVLLDEIEKANSSVCKLFLNIFDDGRLRDSQGNVIEFSNCIVIMTSNLGFSTPEPVQRTEEEILRLLAAKLGHEFVARIQTTLVFDYLSKTAIEQVISIILQSYTTRFAINNDNFNINVDKKAIDYIINNGYSIHLGARSIIGFMEKVILENVAQNWIIQKQSVPGYIPKGLHISFDDNDEIKVELD